MMFIFCLTTGYGKNTDMKWVAANDDGEAVKFAGCSQRFLRKVRKVREVRADDQITGPGPIVFAGFGVKGPAKSA